MVDVEEDTEAQATRTASEEAERDLWFNPHLVPQSARAHKVVGIPLLAVKTHHRKRALALKNLDTFNKVMIAVLSNLIVHYLKGNLGDGVPVPLSHKQLGKKGNRYEPLSFPRSWPKMLTALKHLGFTEVTRGEYSGFPGQSKRTTMRAGPKLIELVEEHGLTHDDFWGRYDAEIIILRRPKKDYWDEGERIDYSDDATTHRFRQELRAINEWLDKADVTFDPTATDRPVNIQARQLRRQFTLGRFDRGGRLFGGFWVNLPKPVRLKGIRIDGEAVVGLDYSQLNPLLAYHVAGAKPPQVDAYTLPGLEGCREGVKKVFNAMLFKHPLTKFPKGSRALFPRKVQIDEVIDAIVQRHPMLKGVLSDPETGHELQFLESEIMMGVLRKCRERNIVSLPVFDCVVVNASAENVVREIMEAEFKATTGLNVEVRRELLSVTSNLPPGAPRVPYRRQ